MSAAYAPAIEGHCCICDPYRLINSNLCVKHKEAGKALAQREGIRFIDAADKLYWDARDVRESYCVEHECWHVDCPEAIHLDFSLVKREAIQPSQRPLLEARRGPLSTGFHEAPRRSSTGGTLVY